MRKLYGYIGDQVRGLSDEPAGMTTFFDREITSENELAEAVVAAAQQVQAAVNDRGRGQSGQMGEYFWADAEDIQETREALMSDLWGIAQQANVPLDTWFTQVMTYKG